MNIKKTKTIYLIGVALLVAQTAAPIVNAYSLSNIDITRSMAPSSFPTGNFQGDFTIDAQNQSVSAGQTANFNIYLKSTGAVTKLTNVDLKIQLPKQDYVEFNQTLDALKLDNVKPSYDAATGILTWHFAKLDAGQVNKTVLRLSTVNGGFASETPVKVTGEITADSDKGSIDAQTSGQTVIKGSKSLSTINKFKSIYGNEEGSNEYHTNPAIDDNILWNVTVGAPKKVDGSIFLKPGSKIKIKYTIDPMLEYVEMADANAPKPTIDGNTLTWELTAPSIADQIASEGSFFTTDLSMKLHIKNDVASVFKTATNTLSVETTFNDGQTFAPDPIDGKITISQSDPSSLPPDLNGGAFSAPHYGPMDGNGNALLKTGEFPDISVDDDATLGFAFLPTSLWANSSETDFMAYSIHYKIDPNLNIKKFFTGDFAFYPNPNVGSKTTPLKNAVHYSISVRYDEDADDAPVTWSNDVMDNIDPETGAHVDYTDAHKNNWHMLMADVPLKKWLTADQLGIPAGKHIKEVLLHFHYAKGTILKKWDGTPYSVSGDENGLGKYYESNSDGDTGMGHNDVPEGQYLDDQVPAGLFASQVLQFNMTPKKGYVGHVENSMYYNFRGQGTSKYAVINGSEYDWHNSPNGKVFSPKSGPQGAEIIKPVEGIDRRLRTGVQFDQLATLPDGSKTLTEGPNTVTAAVQNTKESKNDVTGPLVSYVLLPKGVTFTGNITGSKIAEQVTDNYKGTGQTLVKIAYSDEYLTVDQTSNATFNVNVSAKTSSDPEIMVYSFVPTDKYNVPDIQGTPTITDTQKDVDKDNVNGGGTDKPMFYSGRDYHFDKSNILAVSSKISGTADPDVKKHVGDIVNYELNLKNTSEDTLNNMILMDTLPNVGDLSITTNEDRESQFNMIMAGPITLPKSWSDKVNVLYSTSNNPKKAGVGVEGMLDENTLYPSSAQKLTDASGAEDATWVSAEKVTDWSSIKSFKLELKDGAKWVSGSDMKVKFNLKVPANAQIGQKAYNSFAFAANDSQVIEPYRQAVEVIEKETGKPTDPTNPNKPGNSNKPSTPNVLDKTSNKKSKITKYLPKTGEDVKNASILTIFGIVILGLIGYFIVFDKKRKTDN